MISSDRSARRVSVGRVLLALVAATAGLASVGAISGMSSSGPEEAMLVAWRAFGLVVFAGVFALLAWRPRSYPGIFELAIAHKLALTGFALINADAADAMTVIVADGILTMVLLVAYVLVGANRSWARGTVAIEPSLEDLRRA